MQFQFADACRVLDFTPKPVKVEEPKPSGAERILEYAAHDIGSAIVDFSVEINECERTGNLARAREIAKTLCGLTLQLAAMESAAKDAVQKLGRQELRAYEVVDRLAREQ